MSDSFVTYLLLPGGLEDFLVIFYTFLIFKKILLLFISLNLLG